MWRLRAYAKVFTTSAREDGANPQRLIAALAQNFIRIWLVIVVYGVAYKFNPHPAMSLANTVWTFGLFFAFVLNLGIRNIARLIDIEVKHGTVESGLIKPLDWRLVKLCQLLGKSSLEFGLQLILVPITLLIFVGPPDVSFLSPWVVAGLSVLLIFSVIVPAILFTIVGLSAVWTNDAMPIFRIVDKISAVLTGSFVPLALMPQVIQDILRWSPFGIYAAPQLFFNPQAPALVVPTLISGVLWVAIMLLASKFVWSRVTRRLEVSGG
jgi:ABC-2 type transport system permease protein